MSFPNSLCYDSYADTSSPDSILVPLGTVEMWTCSIALMSDPEERRRYEMYQEDTILRPKSFSLGVFPTKILACRAFLEYTLKNDLFCWDPELYNDSDSDDDRNYAEVVEEQLDTIRTSEDENEVSNSIDWIVEMLTDQYYNSPHYLGWAFSIENFTL